MNQTERIADGKRRFFPAAGKVHDVLLRGVKSHHDKGLERGRDYEVETGGVTLRQIPPAGSTVIILTGDRVRSEQALLVQEAKPNSVTAYPNSVLSELSEPVAKLAQRDAPTVVSSMISTAGPSERDAGGKISPDRLDAPTVFLDNIRPAPNVDPAIFDAPGIKPPTGPDLERLKLALLYGTRDTNDKNATRTAEWQDGLAQLTAVMLNAPDWDATRAAFLDITTYLHRG